jgi:hypothetical protein
MLSGRSILKAPTDDGPELGTLSISTISNADSEQGFGFRITTDGLYSYYNGIWNDTSFGVDWIDDGGATNSFFEAQVEELNSTASITWTGWSGFNDWQSCDQNLQMDDMFAEGTQILVNVHIREIADTGNSVTGFCELYTM